MNPADPNIQRVELVAAALRDYHALEEQFGQRGFTRDLSPDSPICRWQLGAVKVDLMPTDERVLGFGNRWYPLAAATARRVLLPSGAPIHLIAAPAFLATKFEAFLTRGGGDLLVSHDFEDIVNVVEGCATIEADMASAPGEIRAFLAAQFSDVIAAPDFENILPGLLAYDDLHEQRLQTVRRRFRTFASTQLH